MPYFGKQGCWAEFKPIKSILYQCFCTRGSSGRIWDVELGSPRWLWHGRRLSSAGCFFFPRQPPQLEARHVATTRSKDSTEVQEAFSCLHSNFFCFFLKAVWPCDGSLTTHSAFSCVLKEEKRKSGSRNPSKGEIFKGRQSGVVGSGTCAEVKSRLHEDLVLLGCRTS